MQDLAKYLLRKGKRRVKAEIRRRLIAAGVPLPRRRRRPKIPDIDVGGGIEIDIEDLIKGK